MALCTAHGWGHVGVVLLIVRKDGRFWLWLWLWVERTNPKRPE